MTTNSSSLSFTNINKLAFIGHTPIPPSDKVGSDKIGAESDLPSISESSSSDIASAPQVIGLRRQISLRHSTKTSVFKRFKRFYYRHQFELDTTLTVFLFFFDIYKIVMGSFLTVFTYQKCDILKETFGCFDAPYQLAALCWNVVTFVCCFVVLGVSDSS
jgi:hypothetical protein